MGSTRRTARPSSLFDRYRAEALRGIYHRDLSDADREWIWRSLLKGVRQVEAIRLSRLPPERITAALEQVKRWYRQRCEHYKRQQATQAQRPQVVRPVVPVVPRRLWPFGRPSR